MADEMNKENTVEIPESVQAKAGELVREAYRLLTEQAKKLSDELSEFEREDESTRRRIHRGTRRTSGRIV